jgi:hypothetical protein
MENVISDDVQNSTNRSCFIIMPIADSDPYPTGHFKRVYDFIIKPAVIRAGFTPIRADDVLNTNYIAIDIIKRIVTCEMAICDLSSRNPNVFYELGIRQAFNLPVTLIRDSRTKRAFDIQGFRDIEYDENLRIDKVESSISVIKETLENTYKDKGNEINSLITILGVHPAKITSDIEISKDTQIILNALDSFSSRLNRFENNIPASPLNESSFYIDETTGVWKDISSAEIVNLKEGDIIQHKKFGKGKIIAKMGTVHNPIVDIAFQFNGSKKLMLNYANLRKLVNEE